MNIKKLVAKVDKILKKFLMIFLKNILKDFLEKKKEAVRLYRSQIGEFPDLRSIEAVEALARLRGATVNLHAAEAFVLIREIK